MQISTTPSAASKDISSGLGALFREVNALAIRLKGTGVSDGREDALAAGDLSVLRVLDGHGPQTVPQIARFRETSRQNIQILVNKLEAEGFIELSRNPAHKRSGLVGITEAGRNEYAKAADQETKLLA